MTKPLRSASEQPNDDATRVRHAEHVRGPIPPAASVAGAVPLSTSDDPLARMSVYVARILQQQLATDSTRQHWIADGTAAFVDVSGFTSLSEQLARRGREGAEQITDIIGRSFESILAVAYDNGGSLLKFGGDSLLLWFGLSDHATRACRAAVLMRRVLRETGRINLPGAKVTLRMSQGLHSGRFHFFAVGDSHVELLPVGPAWTRLVTMEKNAGADCILMSDETAQRIPERCRGDVQGPGRLLLREPSNHRESVPHVPRPQLAAEVLGRALSPAIRSHVLEGGGAPEHRPVTIAFLRFEETDALLAQKGEEVTAEALHRLLGVVQAATQQQGIALLASDVDADGGKLVLTAGAPRVSGDDEERMLLAVSAIAHAQLPVPVRIGVHRGAVFAGDIGPPYRRTYTVMGDAVNLTARLMAAAPPGEVYVTADVLDHSNTLFETRELPPLTVKGKAQPVRAWALGRVAGSRSRRATLSDYPLIGREPEMATVRDAIAQVRDGRGRLIEVSGEVGIGKTRLLETLRSEASDLRQQHAVCEAYSAHTPYAVWRELLRECMGFGRDDADDAVAERVRAFTIDHAPELLPWLPLIAIPFGVDVPSTPEVDMLAERNRRTRAHEAIASFLDHLLPEPTLIEIEGAHHMDGASSELLAALVARLGDRPWLVALTRRPSDQGFSPPESTLVTRIALGPLAPAGAMRIAELATEKRPLPLHVLKTITERAGGNPQYLRDLLRAAIESGGLSGLPESAEAAAMARIDLLTPQDRALVRRAAVFGLTFHPRNVAWLADESCPVPTPATWERLAELFDEEDDGYYRFRRALLRDAAYEGLPYKLRRRLHGLVAAQIEAEVDDPEPYAATLSLHYFVAGEYPAAWRYAAIGAREAQAVYAYVEAAGLYGRALEAAERLPDVGETELAKVQESLGDAWNRAGDFRKASAAYAAARARIDDDPLWMSRLLLKRSKVEEKLGKYSEALRWAARARKAIEHVSGPAIVRQAADINAWYATVLQAQGRANDALRWAKRAVNESEAIDDSEALGAAYFVMGWVHSELGKGAESLWQRSLDAYRRSGNREREAGLLSNLGAALQMEGRWDEALAYYERGRDASMKIGDQVDAELTQLNIAEILTDRGELEKAEAILASSLPKWRALEYRYFLAACLSMLGRVAIRKRAFPVALERLEEARQHFQHVGAEQDMLDVDARIAECRALMRDTDPAFDLVNDVLGRARTPNGVPKVLPLIERVRGYLLWQRGDPTGARAAFEASLAAARARHDYFEAAFAALSIIELARKQRWEPPLDRITDAERLLAQLKIADTAPMRAMFA